MMQDVFQQLDAEMLENDKTVDSKIIDNKNL